MGDRIDTATVLFTDLVGSTALRSRIGEEAADELRVKHDALLEDAITAHRGTVVKHTGDGAMATFSAAVDAVAAATGRSRSPIAAKSTAPARWSTRPTRRSAKSRCPDSNSNR
jgi:class 3 adenylate cyclase